METKWPQIKLNSNVMSALSENHFPERLSASLQQQGWVVTGDCPPIPSHPGVIGANTTLEPPNPAPQPQASPQCHGSAEGSELITWVLQPCLVARLNSPLTGTEESSLPPQGSDIRGIKHETGSKSSISSLSPLSHKWVPSGWSHGCSTLSWPVPRHGCPPLPVSPCELAAHAKWLFSGVREPVLLLGSFGLFCNEGVVVSRMPRLQVRRWERRRNRKKVGAALDRESTSFPPVPPIPATLWVSLRNTWPQNQPWGRRRDTLCSPSPCSWGRHNPNSCKIGLWEQFPHLAPCSCLCAVPIAQQLQSSVPPILLLLCLLFLATSHPAQVGPVFSFPLPKSTRPVEALSPSRC